MRYALAFFVVVYALVACNLGMSKTETDFKTNVDLLTEIIHDYQEIPEQQKPYEGGFIIWKDPDGLKSFKNKYAETFPAIDDALFRVLSARTNNKWWDDAFFCRAMLYVFWSQVEPTKDRITNAVNVATDYLNNSSDTKFESFTISRMQESVLKQSQHIFTPTLTVEQNFKIFTHAYLGYMYAKLEQYENAIKEYEFIRATYPSSKLAGYIEEHVATLRAIQGGKKHLSNSLP